MHRRPLARTLLAAAVLAAAGSSALAVPLVGLTSSNQLARFDTANIAAASTVAITGLDAGDRFVGIDLRPSDNQLYGITVSNRIYTIGAATGVATFVAALSAPVVGSSLGWGIDFNPVADASGAASLRLISSAGGNYAVNASTGVVGNAANTITAGYTAVAYANSTPAPTTPPTSTQLYYIDTNADTLSVATAAFNTPTITTIGSLGINALGANGFEILGNGQGYAALNTDGATLVTGIYGINLATGAATLLGSYNGTLSGLTAAPVPEPGTVALMAAGLAGVGFVARRRARGR